MKHIRVPCAFAKVENCSRYDADVNVATVISVRIYFCISQDICGLYSVLASVLAVCLFKAKG